MNNALCVCVYVCLRVCVRQALGHKSGKGQGVSIQHPCPLLDVRAGGGTLSAMSLTIYIDLPLISLAY